MVVVDVVWVCWEFVVGARVAMALVVRTVGAWRAMPSGLMATSCGSAARVVCGVEPTRKAQQVLSHSDNTSSNLPRSSSGDGGVRRCQAASSTAVRETTADGATSEMETRCMEESRAALRGSFEAASVSGRSGTAEECRPVHEVARLLSIAMAETTVEIAAEPSEQMRAYYGRRGGGDWYPGLTTPKPLEPEPETIIDKSEMLASFETALQEAGRNAEVIAILAVRAWRKLGDADRAEELYVKALELAPENNTIQASYAEFLWQCDA